MSEPCAETLRCLAALIGFDTTSRNSNVACIDWARAHLEAHGARTRLDWNADRSKVNLLASFGQGPGGLMLSGHVDVVPVDGQDWRSDPFAASVREGRVYGRGACDMKGFDAVVLAQAPLYARASQPVHVALSYDEEVGCLGAAALVGAMAGWGVHPAGCVVGEPTSMRLVDAHKGGRVYRCHVRGRAAHSSLTPAGVNAIEYAALMVERTRAIAARQRASGPRAPGFDVPYTTISTNLVGGGNGGNIVPAEAWFQFDYRYIPGFDPESIIGELEALAGELSQAMQEVAPEAGISFERLADVPALGPEPASAVRAAALAALDDQTVEQVSYGTEAGFFHGYGIPTIVCGPGAITEAHRPDEYVTLDQLARCERFIAAMVARPLG